MVLLAVAACLLAPSAFAGPWLKSLPAAQKSAKEGKQLIFVDLFADWCGWCHQLEQQVFPSEIFQKATSNKVLLRLNTEDGGDGTRLAQQYQVTSLPTSLLLTHDMVVAGVIRGFLPADKMAQAIAAAEKDFSSFQKRAANESAIQSDYQKRLDLTREYRAHFAFGQAATRAKKLVAEPKISSSVRDQAYFELALAQFLDKKYDDAMKTIKSFEEVQSSGDSFERSMMLAGEIYVMQGNYLAAVNELKNFKTKFPNSPMIAQVNMLLPQLERQLNGQVR